MDTSYYHNFIRLVQVGNMTATAAQLHLTQPALSKQVKYLEAEFGTPLLEIKRGQRGMTLHLTDAGRVFYDKAIQLCALESEVYKAVQGKSQDVDGALRISSSASRSTGLIQQSLLEFAQKFPTVRYEIYEGLMADVTDALLSGRSELGLCNTQMVDTNRFDVLCTQSENLYAVYRSDVFGTLPVSEGIKWEELLRCPLSLSGGSARMLMGTDKDLFSQLNVVAVTTTKSSAIEWASSGRTVAIIPMEEREFINRRKMVRVLLPELSGGFHKSLIAVKGKVLSTLAQTFLQFYQGRTAVEA